jgi:peptide/nickel transport system substrate-binding protein
MRLRQAVNFAINREHLMYSIRGNGVTIPALIPRQSTGYDPHLAPYPFDPLKARQLLRAAGYPDGLPVKLIASEDLAVQATVVRRMLEHVGFQVEHQILDVLAYNQKILLSHLDQPAEQQAWDIALMSLYDWASFPILSFYHYAALDGAYDWVIEQPELRHLYEQALHTVDQEQQQALIRQMERHTHKYAYFLFLYNPIQLFAVNKAVEFVPYINTYLIFAETSVTEQHWSMQEDTGREK